MEKFVPSTLNFFVEEFLRRAKAISRFLAKSGQVKQRAEFNQA